MYRLSKFDKSVVVNLILHNPFDNYESSQLRGVTSKFLLYGGPSYHPAPQFVEAPNFL